MTTHVHRFNATLIRNMGRCSCGAWATYDRSVRAFGEPLAHPSTIKGLETRLARIKDPASGTGAEGARLDRPYREGGRNAASSKPREPRAHHDLTRYIKDEK